MEKEIRDEITGGKGVLSKDRTWGQGSEHRTLAGVVLRDGMCTLKLECAVPPCPVSAESLSHTEHKAQRSWAGETKP